MVKSWVSWFKQYRRVLTSDIVHIRRPDGQSIDGIVHVDPANADGQIGMAAFFNPTTTTLNTTLMIPLYYAGVSPGGLVNVSRAEPPTALFAASHVSSSAVDSAGAGSITADGSTLPTNFRSRVSVVLTMPPGTYTMLLIKHAQ
jgi:hypothetical protein